MEYLLLNSGDFNKNHFFDIWDIYNTKEEAEAAWRDQPEGSKYQEIMSMEDFDKMQKEAFMDLPVEEITKEDFEKYLCCLPPLKWTRLRNEEFFFLAEFWTDSYTDMFYRKGQKYYRKLCNIYLRETWIQNFIN